MSDIGSSVAGSKKDELRGVLIAGTRLRNYELVSVLGQGSFGITYRARDTTLGRDVAIKEYLPTSLALRENGTTVLPRSTELAEEFVLGRERFVEEAQTLAKLDHASAVIRVHDFLEANGTAYMVMALAKGETLQHQIKQAGPLSPKAIEHILFPLLDSLEQVHGVGFLHRDIKPSNIILNSDGSPTLIDFGASRASLTDRTKAMTAIFTPGYAAPEQFTSAKQGPWTDIYGLSATIYNAIAGYAPPSAFERMVDDIYDPLVRLQPAGFSIGLLAGIDAGLAIRAFERPQNIEGWRLLLTQSAASESTTATVVMHRGASRSKSTLEPSVSPQLSSTLPRTGALSKRLAIYGGLAAAALTMTGGVYLSFAAKSSNSLQTVAVQDLKAEDLQKLLDQRRKADEAAAEKRRLEEEAQRKADANTNTKTAADAELATAQQQRQKAEEELAQLKAQMAAKQQQDSSQKEQADAAAQRAVEETAQRKAEAEMAALRQAEDNAARKAAAEEETKRRADEALVKAQAERQKADEEAVNQQRSEEAARKAADEAKQKADADAKQKADADATAQKKAAEASETALSLTQTDRQHIQVALTSQGFDTHGNDGALGPRSREMIMNWQKARNQLATGYLDRAQQQALLKEASAAVSQYDDQQKKIEDEKKAAEESKIKADEEAKARATAPVLQISPIPSTPPAPTAPQYDGKWAGDVGAWHVTLSVLGTTGTLSLSCNDGTTSDVLPVKITKDGHFQAYIHSHSGRQEVDAQLPSLTIAPNTFCNGGNGKLSK